MVTAHDRAAMLNDKLLQITKNGYVCHMLNNGRRVVQPILFPEMSESLTETAVQYILMPFMTPQSLQQRLPAHRWTKQHQDSIFITTRFKNGSPISVSGRNTRTRLSALLWLWLCRAMLRCDRRRLCRSG
jgi:hypothetical protein